jgi:hypothetical protein
MIGFIRKLRKDRKGNILVIAGAALPLVVGSAGLATDTIQWVLWKRQLQRAADSAAIAGVYDRIEAGNTDSVESTVAHDLTLNLHTGFDLLDDQTEVTTPGDEGDNVDQVHVKIAAQRALPFSSMFMSAAPTIIAEATAASVPGSDDYCVLSLESTAKTGIYITGSSTIAMDCGMMTNSVSANNAAQAAGGSNVTATSVAAQGGIQQSNNWHVDVYDPYQEPKDDPYAGVNIDKSEMKCAGHNKTQGGKTTWVNDALTEDTDLNAAKDVGNNKANCFSSLSVGSGKTLTLPAGTYYINAGDVNIQGNLVANQGTTIVLTNSSNLNTATIGSFVMNAGATLDIVAPSDDSNPYHGIAVYQDRRAQDKMANQVNMNAGSPNKINGNSSSSIIGALYFPKTQVTFNGGGTAGYKCTQFVIKRLYYSGNAGMSNSYTHNCDGTGMEEINGGRRVRLVA